MLASSVKGCCAHIDVTEFADDVDIMEFADGSVPGGKFGYVYDKAGNKLVDQNGNFVKLYFQSYGGYHLVVDDSSGRVVGHNKEDPLVKAVFTDPFDPTNRRIVDNENND